ncbi:MarR family winged helix-turn-helix transcriptional regulator [Corynebacterium sp. UBA2622]|uniref:MarR family winged helix-turn-helix transcriptional regulator n=1 Tax=Corynebacterium sp. UBA2622 TaxID=1946393 RepID=UPI0025B95901|nr:MarR family transcriptional regulator [Corynebacterium sp. UBA2622]
MKDQDLTYRTMSEVRTLTKKIRGARISHNMGITYNESLIMATIRENPGVTSKELAAQLQSDKSTISRQVAELEKRGYLERRMKSGNRRIHELFLTSRGEETLAEADSTWARIIAAKQAGWTEREKEDFLRLLGKYNESE